MQVRVISVATNAAWPRMAVRLAVSLAVAGLFLWLLRARLSSVDLPGIMDQTTRIAPAAWVGAGLAICISFWAVGRYDLVMHQHLGTGVSGAAAHRAGIAAIAISQTVGAGIITSALLRWRLLHGVSLWQATRISVAVTLSFLAGWAVVTAIALTVLPNAMLPGVPLHAIAAVVLFFAAVLGVIGASAPQALRRFHLPNALTQTRLVGLAAVDTLAACIALWLLLPPDSALPLCVLLPAFLIALGAGLVSGTPGGVGPFEVTLLALLPGQAEGPLLAAIMGWRLVGYALPAVLGALVAIIGPAPAPRGPNPDLRMVRAHRTAALIDRAKRAETGLARQGALHLMDSRLGSAWLTGRTPHALIGLLDPVGGDQPSRAALCALAHRARSEARLPALYKVTARTAVTARGLGWRVLPLGAEAVIAPAAFDLKGSCRAALRRKLRRASGAGVTIAPGTAAGAAERAAIARLWARARKGERGFSMGRYAEDYLSLQLLLEARLDGHLVAFVSFHTGMQEWTLDLMRQTANAPDGTVQALVCHAICLAAVQRIPRLSLAASLAPRPLPPALQRFVGHDDSGLARFKLMFAPRWQPLYLCAPHWPALVLAGAEIARAVHRPAPLFAHSAQDHHAHNGIASAPVAWHTGL